MRRTSATLLACAALAAVPLAGCGGDDEDEPQGGAPPAATEQTGGSGGEGGGGAANASAGRELFTESAQPPCASCHTLADADSNGSVGPNLDELRPSAEQVSQAIRSGPSVMPEYPSLSDEQVQTLADYVSSAAGG
jgi:mono/diheme cytochrome c family protein